MVGAAVMATGGGQCRASGTRPGAAMPGPVRVPAWHGHPARALTLGRNECTSWKARATPELKRGSTSRVAAPPGEHADAGQAQQAQGGRLGDRGDGEVVELA